MCRINAALLLALLALNLGIQALDVAGDVYLVLGDSGGGKSALVNMIVGAPVSLESADPGSATKQVVGFTVQHPVPGSRFPPGTLVVDTPGFRDTDGLSLAQIAALIRAQLYGHQDSKIAGVLLVVDGFAPRFHLGRALQDVISVMGPGVLPYVTVVVTKTGAHGEDASEKLQELLLQARTVLAAAGGDARQVVLVDSKAGLRQANMDALAGALPSGADGYELSGMDDLVRREEQYLAEELASEANWETITEQVPRVVSRTVTKTVMADESYVYECNCQRVCKFKFGVCWKKRRVCGTCAGSRKVPRQLSEVVHETLYDSKTTRQLANGREFYQQKAKQRVLDELRASVFGAQQ